ncbi:hypothetical protein J6590_055587 [Homalodisca vitripennis]|nr:hypothetical protein J6590_055587 [Homalodisca vitripennis]
MLDTAGKLYEMMLKSRLRVQSKPPGTCLTTVDYTRPKKAGDCRWSPVELCRNRFSGEKNRREQRGEKPCKYGSKGETRVPTVIEPFVSSRDMNAWMNRGLRNVNLCQFLTGHDYFRKYLYDMRKNESPRCVYCPENDDDSPFILRVRAFHRTQKNACLH